MSKQAFLIYLGMLLKESADKMDREKKEEAKRG